MDKKELSAIYLAGLLQGIVLVAFPAASTLFTNPEDFNFSAAQYGTLFLPQSILSIVASVFSSKMSQRYTAKTTYLLGLLANLVSMLLFASSSLIMKEGLLAYSMLILATSCLGIGFGLTVPTLNTTIGLLRPKQVNTVTLILNALLGVGTVLAPLFTSVFIALGVWWGLPLLLVFSLGLLVVFSLPLSFPKENTVENLSSGPIPKSVYVFSAFAVLYGIVETLNGNWAVIYMREVQHAPAHIQSLALTLFWTMVTLGRVSFALGSRYFTNQRVYQGLPIVVMAAFALLSLLNPNNLLLSLTAVGLAGLGCSALLPLTISFGSSQLPTISQSVAGIVIACYLTGYGIAAFGPGVILDHTHYNLSDVYGFGCLAAISLAVLAFFINRSSKS